MNPTDAISPPQELSVLQSLRGFRASIFKMLFLSLGMIATSGWIYLLWKAAIFIGGSIFA